MARIAISREAFAAVVRAGDSRRFDVNLKDNREAVLSGALQEALTQPPILAPHFRTPIRGAVCVSYTRYEDNLVLRAIARHLKIRLGIRMPSRDAIVQGVIEALLDGTPFTVVRRDIASFYETLPIDELRTMLTYDPASPSRVRQYFKAYFDQHCAGKAYGLPRGVGLSAILAEYRMRSFDQKVRELPGVYRYFRFSDDILVFTFGEGHTVEHTLEQLLPEGMTFNAAKSDLNSFGTNLPRGSSETFEYLGYSFSASTDVNREARQVSVAISQKKMGRLRSRIILSLKAHAKHPDASLLIQRLSYLAGNYATKRRGMSASRGNLYVRSGIYYSYRHCGVYVRRQNNTEKLPADLTGLMRLDGFFHSIISSTTSEFSPLIGALAAPVRAKIKRISFAAGFSHKLMVRFRPEEIPGLKKVWRNV